MSWIRWQGAYLPEAGPVVVTIGPGTLTLSPGEIRLRGAGGELVTGVVRMLATLIRGVIGR